MEQLFILIVTSLTSMGACIVGMKVLRLPGDRLWLALGSACECVGWMLIFFLMNMIVGIIAIFATRAFIGSFVSLYNVSDVTLVVLSLLQALVFREWRASSRRGRPSDARDNGLFRYNP